MLKIIKIFTFLPQSLSFRRNLHTALRENWNLDSYGMTKCMCNFIICNYTQKNRHITVTILEFIIIKFLYTFAKNSSKIGEIETVPSG